MKTIMRVKSAFILFLLLFFLANFIIFNYGQKLLEPRVKDNVADSRIVEIKSGYSLNKIGSLLYEEGLINSSLAFEFYLRIKGKTTNLQAGYYDLNPTMSTTKIIDKLLRGDNAYYSITIPEGTTVEGISNIFLLNGLDRDIFLEEANNMDLQFIENKEDLIYIAEGFLFPDTYKIPYGSSERDVIRMMLRQFQRRVANLEEEIQASGYSLHQIVTIASMIEAEAKVGSEGPKVASVIHNRIEQGMRLQLDATVQYILPERQARLLYRSLEVDSPYNTYRNSGLPPGPIGNPGINAIEAALNPADTDYLFYVARGDGGHIFTRTYREHLDVQRDLN